MSLSLFLPLTRMLLCAYIFIAGSCLALSCVFENTFLDLRGRKEVGRGKKNPSHFSVHERRGPCRKKRRERKQLLCIGLFVDYIPVWPGTGPAAVDDLEFLITLLPPPKHQCRECGTHCHFRFQAALAIGPRASWMTGEHSAN